MKLTVIAGPEIIILATSNLNGLHSLIANSRTFRIDQDLSSVTNNIEIALSASSRSGSFINLTFSVASGGTLSIPLMNTWLNETNAGIESEEAIEEPPIGATDVRLLAERIEFADGQFVSQSGIPNWRVNGRSHPMGGSYGKTMRLADLTLVTNSDPDIDDHYTIPWDDKEAVYDLRAVHIESTTDLTLRLGDHDEMALVIGSQFAFDIHNSNAHGGATLIVQENDGTDIITLLPREIFPVVVEWFTDSSGEIRSGRRITRPLEVSADNSYGNADTVGYLGSPEHPLGTSRHIPC